jgi:hypothetical protein
VMGKGIPQVVTEVVHLLVAGCQRIADALPERRSGRLWTTLYSGCRLTLGVA